MPCVAIVSPSGYAPDPEAVVRGITNLEAQGCQVLDLTDPASRHHRFGATDAQRLAQLVTAARHPDVDIVMALRGGYGLTRLLPQMDFNLLANSGKLFVGHSDFTALQMGMLATCGAISFSAPMLCDDFVREEPSAFSLRNFWQCLTRDGCVIEGGASGNPTLDVAGTIWGGNLAMLTHLVGSPWLPSIEGGILFVEDVNEHPYRVERMLLQLAHAGILQRQKAILLGDFSGYRLTDYDNGYDFEQMLLWLRSQIDVPILNGLPIGHGRDKTTIPVGAHAHLQSADDHFALTISSYPHLP
ncbi:muramoyltetrapeptide carboxypeptidase [uncultured Oxalicibacterium sp.]|uniref:muramoyltetrapeptide carboxypeptidase n=1 Tax=uncultured Oxalicibacterium sp. TaxID=1168540 RepID=UPI0025E32127|nr:muramoyltetrapeptide carboxypeptidase [uncultured Oxalicibacterium sp.]